MTRDPIIEELHKVREKIGRAHDYDVQRIAGTIRRHETERRRASRRQVEHSPAGQKKAS